MIIIIKTTILFILLLGLFVYLKLQPHATILIPKAAKYFLVWDEIFRPVFSLFSRKLPVKLKISDYGLILDFGQIIVFANLLIVFRLL